MAKTVTDPPGTAGSQFFIVTADDAGPPPDYALLNHVVAGWPVVAAIAELSDRASERPWERVAIERMELVERPT